MPTAAQNEVDEWSVGGNAGVVRPDIPGCSRLRVGFGGRDLGVMVRGYSGSIRIGLGGGWRRCRDRPFARAHRTWCNVEAFLPRVLVGSNGEFGRPFSVWRAFAGAKCAREPERGNGETDSRQGRFLRGGRKRGKLRHIPGRFTLEGFGLP